MKQIDVDFYSTNNASDFVDNLADQGHSPSSSLDTSTGITTVTFYKEQIMIKLILCLPITFIDIVLAGYGIVVSLLLWNDKYLTGVDGEVNMFSLATNVFSKDGFRF